MATVEQNRTEGQVRAQAGADDSAPFEIPGATGGQFRIQVLNQDAARGVVTTIVHLPPGGRIPAHRHRAGSEMHFVLEGDLIEGGEALGPGAFLTQAAGVVHGPHESPGGARVLTVQQWQSRDGDFDFEIVEESAAAAPPPAQGRNQDGGRGAEAAEGVPRVGDDAAAAQSPQARRETEQSLGKGYG